VDWDNDGLLDLIVGDGNSNVHLYLNIADNTNPSFTIGTLLITENELEGSERITPVTHDWNNDGNKDIIVGGMDGRIRFYINKGNDAAPLFDEYYYLKTGNDIFRISSRSAPRMYDFNKDGLKDILVGEVIGHVYFLKNVGTNDTPAFKRIDKLFLKNGDLLKYPGSNPRSRLDVTDWNNDGADDIIVGGMDGRVMLFLASEDKSISISNVLNRAKTSSIESLLKIKKQTKKFLKTVRDKARNSLNS